ncbi:MAG: Rrf2 family transcriptional regulator [Clostridiales bacterium]|nr:Rrf2 family transcriptional regulator [Clostridiales bacterium]
MKISTKGRYALRMFLDLAEHKDDGYIALKDIAARQGISKKYLEQIIPSLNGSGLLKTNRGYQGGYMLGVPPDQCSVGMILRLTEGSIAPIACLDASPISCEKMSSCITLPFWKGLNKVINDYVDGVTLQDLLDQHRECGIDNYQI